MYSVCVCVCVCVCVHVCVCACIRMCVYISVCGLVCLISYVVQFFGICYLEQYILQVIYTVHCRWCTTYPSVFWRVLFDKAFLDSLHYRLCTYMFIHVCMYIINMYIHIFMYKYYMLAQLTYNACT